MLEGPLVSSRPNLDKKLPGTVSYLCLCFLMAAAAAEAQPTFNRTVGLVPVSRDGQPIPEPWTGGLLSPRPALFDQDGDGDLDLTIVQGGGGITHYRNEGDAQTFEFRFDADNWQDVDAGTWATWADIDGDGDLDLFTDGNGSVVFHRNTGTPAAPVWVLEDLQWQGIINSGAGNTPVFADIDGDLDLDYLEMEQNFGTARLYRNDGTPQSPVMVFVTSNWACIDTFAGLVGEGPASANGSSRHGISVISVADIDSDADLDIFIGDLFNQNLWFFRNDNPGPSVCYVRVTGEYLPVATSGLNAPTVGDLDGDLDLDMVVGVANQSAAIDNLMYLENQGSPQVPQHVVQTMNLIPAIDVGSGSRPAFGDLDDDGDPDFLLGAEDGTIQLFVNTGSPTAPSYAWIGALQDAFKVTIDVGFWSAPELVDYDGDGDLDLFIGAGNGRVLHYRNDGTPAQHAFQLVDTQFTGVRADFNAVPAVGDLDDDGDYDLLVGEFGTTLNPRLFYMRNDGTIEAPIWVEVSDNTANTFIFAERVFVGNVAPELFDLDEDNDLDLFVGEREGNVNYYRNDGSAQAFDFVLVDEAFAGAQVGLESGAAFVNIDGDQDADLLIGEKNGGANLYIFGSPVAVELGRFAAVDRGGWVELEWSTTFESDHLGFNVWRAAVSGGSTGAYERLNAAPLAGGPPYRFVDRDVEVGRTYAYKLEDVARDGRRGWHGPVEVFVGSALAPAAAMPVAGVAEFSLRLPVATDVEARVYGADGRLVRQIARRRYEAGEHRIGWDGRDGRGAEVPSGVYWLRVKAREQTLISKLVMVR